MLRILFVLLAMGSSITVAAGPWHGEPVAEAPHIRAPSTPESLPGQEEPFAELADRFLSFHLYFHPVHATLLGVHDYDGRLPDLSEEGILALSQAYREWLSRVEEVDRSALQGSALQDRRVMEYAIREALLELDVLRRWRSDPGLYLEIISRGLEPLTGGSFAPLAERMGSVTERERQIPNLLAQARRNLVNPPREATQRSLERSAELLVFLRRTLPSTFASVQEGPDKWAFEQMTRQAVSELDSFTTYLQDDLLPRSNGDARIPEETFRQLFLYFVHMEMGPLDGVLERIDGEILRYSRWIESEAGRIDPSLPVYELFDRLVLEDRSYTDPAQRAEQMMEEARSFILRNGLVSLPGASLPLVLGRPASAGGPLVSLVTPGVLGDTESSVSLEVGVPGFGESAEIAQRLDRQYRAGGIELLTLRESLPGALVHWLHLRATPSPLRKAFLHPSSSEGWALYAEEMILDRGLGSESPALRLRQLQSSLFELALSRVGILLHQGEMTPIDAAAYLADVAYVDDETALLGVREVALDPLRGAASLIKAEIRQLGQDFQEHLVESGVTFSTQDFHDRLLSEGLPPSLAREVMIGTEQDREE